MAKKRMFDPCVVRSDAFLDMPSTSQLLYFHLGMEADDDGVVANVGTVRRICGCSEDDLRILAAKRFVLLVGEGLILIKHWKMNNYIRSDRYQPTKYPDALSGVYVKANKAYTLDSSKAAEKALPDGSHELGIPLVYQRYTQSSLDKISIDKSCCCIDNVSSSDTDDNNNVDSSKSRLAEIRELLEAKGMPKSERQSFLDYNCAEHGDEAVLSMSDEKIAYLAGRWMACSNSRK